jgi:hypothetical protein
VIGIQKFVIAAVAAALAWAPSAGAQDSTARPIPDGLQWTGFTCMSTSGCACPSDAGASFRATHCTAGGMIPFGNPLLTLIWGAGQHNWGGTTLTGGPSIPAACKARDAPPSLTDALATSAGAAVREPGRRNP